MPRSTTASVAEPAAHYLELQHRIEDLVHALGRGDDDGENAALLAELATASNTLAQLVHTHATLLELEPRVVRTLADDARFAVLCADLASARATGRPPTSGLMLEFDEDPGTRRLLNHMASPAVDQPGWVLAHQLNTLIDAAIELGIGTDLAQRLAWAVSCRPDGENAAEHEAASIPDHAASHAA
ncbi:hypothetical protein L3Q67_45080 (plasmid) [Saccharothrix sp. AJ9571]|nr:hypothetical protein L3Q67_45080 [Saccharothrix sp. AJ9571]